MYPQRLPIVDDDDGVWGDILRKYLLKEHFDDGTDSPANGGHKNVTIRAGVASPGGAPLKFTSGTLLTTPEVGAMEFAGDNLYITQTSGVTRKKVALYDDEFGATGDLYYRNNTGYFTRLAIGTASQILTVQSGVPTWQTPSVTSTFNDATFTLQDSTDTSKAARLNVPTAQTASTTRTHTLPATDSVLVGETQAQTLSNKTLTAPVISTISNSGTLTLPTGTHTLVGKATVDVLTNKTIDANGTGNSITNLEVADFAAGVIDTDLSTTSANDNTLPSAKATKTALDGKAEATHTHAAGDITSGTLNTAQLPTIEKTNLSTEVQASLDKADAAIQESDVVIGPLPGAGVIGKLYVVPPA